MSPNSQSTKIRHVHVSILHVLGMQAAGFRAEIYGDVRSEKVNATLT